LGHHFPSGLDLDLNSVVEEFISTPSQRAATNVQSPTTYEGHILQMLADLQKQIEEQHA